MEFLVEVDIDVPDRALGSEGLETVRPPRPPPRRSWRGWRSALRTSTASGATHEAFIHTRQLDDADLVVARLDRREGWEESESRPRGARLSTLGMSARAEIR
jgi:hypothetical protein